jgi:hypothetical protein
MLVVAGFYDGGGDSYGFMRSSLDGITWSANQKIGTPWAGIVQDNFIVGTSSSAVWRMKPGSSGGNATDWKMSKAGDGWLAGPISVKADSVNVTGSSFCSSTDGANSFQCHDPVDPDGDGGIAYSSTDPAIGITGGGDISPTVNGWVHRTTDGGTTWSKRVLSSKFPIRAVYTECGGSGIMIAAGGDFFSGTLYQWHHREQWVFFH